jgi:hypothetical protein
LCFPRRKRIGQAKHDHWEIRLKGHLGVRWAGWFGDLEITHAAGGTTVLRGPVSDQAALHGLLRKVRDLGLPLVSATQVESRGNDTAGAPTGHTTHPHTKRSTR